MKLRLFMCIPGGTGVVYCDTWRQEHGDYLKIGFLCFATLKLTIYDRCHPDLAIQIRKNAREIQNRVGEEYLISSSQTITLGYEL